MGKIKMTMILKYSLLKIIFYFLIQIDDSHALFAIKKKNKKLENDGNESDTDGETTTEEPSTIDQPVSSDSSPRKRYRPKEENVVYATIRPEFRAQLEKEAEADRLKQMVKHKGSKQVQNEGTY